MRYGLTSSATVWVVLIAMALIAPPVADAQHPLDSLSSSEYAAVLAILTADGHVLDTTRFTLVSLIEPEKSAVKAFSKGDPISRKAFAVIKEGAVSYKAEIDITSETVTSFEEATGEGMVLLEEIYGATDLAISAPDMIKGLADRGLTPDDVYCLPLTAGSFGNANEQDSRLMKVPCYVLPGEGSNWYAKPIEGLFALVDLNTNLVFEVVDTGVVPINEDGWGYTAAEVEARFGNLRGTSSASTADSTTSQASAVPDDVGYSIDGSVVTWDIWRFHYRTDKRPGVILNEIDVNDQGTWREVLYEAHLSEVFVPYMDPDVGWYWRTYMDSGEYGFGIFMTPLTPGVDCPKTATYLGSTFHDDVGMPFTVPGTICVFERSIGDPSWRHFEIFAQGPDTFTPAEGRASTELVVRYASEVGNYDYLIDYIFQQDGTMKVAVGSTGLDAVKGVASQSMHNDTAEQDTKYGTLIAPNLVAPFHDHYFNFRLDFDVDGESNDFKKAKIRPLNLTDMDIPRKSMWGVTYEVVESEIEARTKITPDLPSNYYFVNRNKESGLGHNPGYQLIPDSYAYGLMSLDDMPIKRNAFIENQLWVTPYDPTQKYAGGEYAFQSTGNDTLLTWTDADRPIVNADIVAYYTIGFHHVPRMEDWPVMPIHWGSFQLRPFNFFTHNPAITIAPVGSTTSVGTEAPRVTTASPTATTSSSMVVSQSLAVIIVLTVCALLW
jgi:primary-amine oxidase